MSLSSNFATDSKKENDGVKILLPPNEDGSIPSVTIARAGRSNKRYSKALETATKPYRRQIDMGTLDNDVAEKMFLKVFAETIVRDWEFMQDEPGINIPFSKENSLKLLEKYPELYDYLQKEANAFSTFRVEAMDDEAKN